MALYVREFVVDRVADIHLAYHDAIRLAEQVEATYVRLGRPGRAAHTADALRRAYAAFSDDLDALAKATAIDAQKRMRDQLRLTRKRPDTRMTPQLRNNLIARPEYPGGKLATGVVGVADIERLDSVVNPLGPQYGPYWRAQEYGTTAHVGRVIRGFFFGPGGGGTPSRPQAQYAGGKGPHPIFVTAGQHAAAASVLGFSADEAGGGGTRGGLGGFGTIRHPIQPRFFIRDGANQAEAEWRTELALLERKAVARLDRVL